jgi:signal transduction histidine kinase
MTEMVALHEMVYSEDGKPVNYRITDCNRAFSEILAIPRDAAVGKLATEVYKISEPPYLAEYSSVVITQIPYHFETYFGFMDKHFAISVVSPGKGQFATITTDITAIKNAQQTIAAKNKELEQLVYVASHDLRSPLVNVDGYSRELGYSIEDLKKIVTARSELPPDFAAAFPAIIGDMSEALTHIRNSTKQMDSLLKGLLKLSRIGRAALNIGPLDMNRIIGDIVTTFAFETKKAEIEIAIEPLPPCRGDAVQVTQIFTNLISNAIKYLDGSRPGRIRISGSAVMSRSTYCVEDNGIGIASQHQDNIFQLFHRLNPGKTEGEGLGLTIVKQALGMLDGEITLDSKPDSGSRFFVRLPFMPLKETNNE